MTFNIINNSPNKIFLISRRSVSTFFPSSGIKFSGLWVRSPLTGQRVAPLGSVNNSGVMASAFAEAKKRQAELDAKSNFARNIELDSLNPDTNIISSDFSKMLSTISRSLDIVDVINDSIEKNYEENSTELDFLGTSNNFSNSLKILKEVSERTSDTNSYMESLIETMMVFNKKVRYSDDRANEILEDFNNDFSEARKSFIGGKIKKALIFSGLCIGSALVIYSYFLKPGLDINSSNSINSDSSNLQASSSSHRSAGKIMHDSIVKSRTELEINSPILGDVHYSKEKYSVIIPSAKYAFKLFKSFFFN